MCIVGWFRKIVLEIGVHFRAIVDPTTVNVLIERIKNGFNRLAVLMN